MTAKAADVSLIPYPLSSRLFSKSDVLLGNERLPGADRVAWVVLGVLVVWVGRADGGDRGAGQRRGSRRLDVPAPPS
jgi:hypothetical protein